MNVISEQQFRNTNTFRIINERVNIDPFADSAFLPFKQLSSKPKGAYFEKLFEEYASALGENISKAENTGHDRISDVYGKVEVKGSFGWITNGVITHFRWQQIRPNQDYDNVVFIAAYPHEIKFYIADKETVRENVEIQDGRGRWIHNQHGGMKVNSGTFFLDGFPKDFPWMEEYSV